MKLISLKLKEGGGAVEEMVLMEIGFRFGNLSPVAPRHILVMGESLCRKWTHHRPKVPPHSLWTHISHFCQKHKKIASLKIYSLLCVNINIKVSISSGLGDVIKKVSSVQFWQ